MAHQAVRNGPVASRERQNNGVIKEWVPSEPIWRHSPYCRCAWPPAIDEKVPRLQLQS